MGFVFLTLQALTYIVIADSILSWIVPNPSAFPRSLTSRIVEPLYLPFRKLVPPTKTGGFDLAPLAVILAIQGLMAVIVRAG